MYMEVAGRLQVLGAWEKSLKLLEGQAAGWRRAWSPHSFRQNFMCQMHCLKNKKEQDFYLIEEHMRLEGKLSCCTPEGLLREG